MKNLLLILSVIVFYNSKSQASFNFYKDRSLEIFKVDKIQEEINKAISNEDLLPETIHHNFTTYKINYSIDEKLNDVVKNILRRSRSDYIAAVIIDNNTGEVLSIADYNKKDKKFGRLLALNATSPAASIFKVITAAELLENTPVENETKFAFNGKGSTLYKSQLKPLTKNSKWIKKTTLNQAFAYSNNVIFGKAAINNTNISSLNSMAEKFGFNKSFLPLLDIQTSKLFEAKDSYNLAELASGFNRDTLISPLHGAVIASVVANDGILKEPVLVKSIEDNSSDRVYWKPESATEQVLSLENNLELKTMMKRTITNGTARGAFRPWKTKRIKDIEIGGKTGSITGGVPFGKRDWFVSYAIPPKDGDKGISVAVMIVNLNKWFVRSSYVTKDIIEYYYTKHKKE